MVQVQIDNVTRELSQVHESWINQQINRRRDEGAIVCVQIIIDSPGAKMRLITNDCPSFSGGRPPSKLEEQIYKLWEKRVLCNSHFMGGNVIAFLKQLQSLI